MATSPLRKCWCRDQTTPPTNVRHQFPSQMSYIDACTIPEPGTNNMRGRRLGGDRAARRVRWSAAGRPTGRQFPGVIGQSGDGLLLWRVGYHADPLGLTPWELYSFSHRFDDIHRRFRALYCAELAETCLREML